MRIKTFVNGRNYIDGMVNEFLLEHDVCNIQTHLASDQQVIVIVVYKEACEDGR